MTDILQAIILGIIEGFTEFLPISSTGHLIVAEDLLGYKDSAETFAIVIQTGAILAIIWHYRKDLTYKIKRLFTGDQAVNKFWSNLVIATIPVGIVGYIFQDTISKYTVALTIAITLIVGGVIIWLIETYHKTAKSHGTKPQMDRISPMQAFQVGLYQVIALIPGVSRSASTIMGGVLSGFDRVTATTFSFYLSIPVLLITGAYKLLTDRDEIDTISGGGAALVVGTAVSFIAALIAIKWLLKYVSTKDFKIFAYYRIVLGVIILVALV